MIRPIRLVLCCWCFCYSHILDYSIVGTSEIRKGEEKREVLQLSSKEQEEKEFRCADKMASSVPSSTVSQKEPSVADNVGNPHHPHHHGRESRGNLECVNIPPRDLDLGERLTAYQNVRHSSFGGFVTRSSPSHNNDSDDDDDEGSNAFYMTTKFGETTNIHYCAGPMMMRQQLTFAKEPVSTCQPTPNLPTIPNGFVYGKDTGGNENVQLYFFDVEKGRHTLLTDGKSMHRSPTFSTNDNRLAFASNARDGTHFDIYTLTINEENLYGNHNVVDETKDVTTQFQHELIHSSGDQPGYLSVPSFSDENYLIMHYVSVTDSSLFLIQNDDGENKKVVPIAPSDPKKKVSVSGGELIFNKKTNGLCGILFASDEDAEFKTLRYYDIKLKREIRLHADQKWDVDDFWISSSGNLLVEYNEGGCSTLYAGKLRDEPSLQEGGVLTTNSLRKIEVLAQNDLLGVMGKGSWHEKNPNKFGFSITSGKGPSDVYTLEFDQAGGADQENEPILTRCTRSEVGGLDTSRFVSPRLIEYKSFDGLMIPAFVYCPPQPAQRKGKKVPVIIHPHGGPEGQHRPRFQPLYQYLMLEMGICVIDPNVRGSAGYGKKFVTLDDCEKREDSVRDIGALIDWIKDPTNKYNFDPDRIAIWGGSYGGYMCLASLIHFNSILKCGVNTVGISNFVTFLENTQSYRRDLRRLKYGDERDPQMRALLESISPLNNAEKIKAPLLIVQGKNDPRVPVSEAEQIFETVTKNGNEVWYLLANDEGHGFKKRSNIDAYQEAMIQFWNRFLV